MIIGIALDRWKLEAFKKHLKEAGYTYRESAGDKLELTLLSVDVTESEDALNALAIVVGKAQRACAS